MRLVDQNLNKLLQAISNDFKTTKGKITKIHKVWRKDKNLHVQIWEEMEERILKLELVERTTKERAEPPYTTQGR